MKATWKNMPPYTGKADEPVYYFNRRVGRVLCRKKPDRKPDATNKTFTDKQKRIFKREKSEGFLNDMRTLPKDMPSSFSRKTSHIQSGQISTAK